MGSTYEGEWSCLSKMYTTTEESDFMAQLLGGLNSVQNDQALGTSLSLSVASDHRMPEIRSLGKKWRSSEHVKNKPRNVKPRKTQKAESTSEVDEDATWGPNNSQSSSLTCSENENTASQNGESSSILKVQPALNLNGKTRAGRGSATDPQSLYARKRRERINERLKTLQGLVPNGTKVDISTMLEEAVQYVKFLQLQIKLLSSDDLWIYAPLAYNGMDIGDFDLNERTERSM